MQEQTEHGTPFRILTLIDEYTRQRLAVHVAWSIRAVDVITVVEAAFARYGTPAYIRSDNGPEFIAYASARPQRPNRSTHWPSDLLRNRVR